MSIFDVFNLTKSRKPNSHLKNLVALAKLDNNVTQEEFDFLIKVAQRVGIKESEIKDMLSRTTSVKVSKPENDASRFILLFDLVEMTLADKVMLDEEIDYCIDMAAKMGFRAAISGVLVRQIASDMLAGLTREQIMEKAKSYLKI